jgi:hypothetical protein
MATVRHLGLFALPNLPFGGTGCPQPSEVFTADQLGVPTYTVYPADLEGSLLQKWPVGQCFGFGVLKVLQLQEGSASDSNSELQCEWPIHRSIVYVIICQTF